MEGKVLKVWRYVTGSGVFRNPQRRVAPGVKRTLNVAFVNGMWNHRKPNMSKSERTYSHVSSWSDTFLKIT